MKEKLGKENVWSPPADLEIASEQQAMTRMLQAGHQLREREWLSVSVSAAPPPASHGTMMGMAKHLGGDLLSSGRKHDKQTGEMSDSKALKEALKLAKHKGDFL